jgi:adenylosuccinate synthase
MPQKITALVDLLWGDNAKGKVTSYIAPNYDIVCRPTSGANSGHVIVVDGQKHTGRLIPSGIFSPDTKAVLGNGMVICPFTLVDELNSLEKMGLTRLNILHRIVISDHAHVVLPYHKFVDKYLNSSGVIGTTKNGIGMCYSDKVSRRGIRFFDLIDQQSLQDKLEENMDFWANILLEGDNKYLLDDRKICLEYEEIFNPDNIIEMLKPILNDILPLVENTSVYLNDAYRNGKRILLEGAQGSALSLDHGTYPFVTSCDCSIGGMVSGSGLAANKISDVIGVTKGYVTRVGAGPFPTKLEGETAEFLQTAGNEFGSVTGRPRDVGWLDLELLKYAIMINGVTELALTKLDVMSGLPDIKICTSYRHRPSEYFNAYLNYLYEVEPMYKTLPGWSEDISQVKCYEDLPQNTKDYISFIENEVEVPVKIISVGADRECTFIKG